MWGVGVGGCPPFSMNAPVMVQLDGETDPLEVREPLSVTNPLYVII